MMNFTNPDYLYRLARSGNDHDRQELAIAVQDMLGTEHSHVATDILLLLLKEAEFELRLMLAEKLAPMRECPMDLIHFLIFENPFVIADPVLRHSPLLNDDELIRILSFFSDDPQYMHSIAQRNAISATVSAKILEQGDEEAHLLLLKNKNAELNDLCLDYLVDLSKKRPPLQQPFIKRREVTPAIAAKLFWYVASDLRLHILENFPIEPAKLDRAVESSIQHQLDMKAGSIVISTDAKIKAERLSESGALNVRQIMEALRRGDVPLFVCMIALLTHTQPEKMVGMLLNDTTETLTIIAHVMRMNRNDFNGLYLLWRRQTQPNSILYEQDISHAQNTFTATNAQAVETKLQQWQDDSLRSSDR